MKYKDYKGNRDDLIRKYIPFSYSIAKNYRHLSYNNLHGLEGEALLALCNAVDLTIAKPEMWDISIESIIVITIKRQLIEYGNKDRPLHQSRGAYRKGFSKCPGRVLSDDIYDVLDIQRTKPSLNESICIVSEILDDVNLDNREKHLVALLLSEYTPSEIAAAMEISESYFYRIQGHIREKFRGRTL